MDVVIVMLDDNQACAQALEDIKWMEHAQRLADKAAALGEIPVGAVVVAAGEMIGEGFNCPIASQDPTAHAEVIALRQAAQRLGNYRLVDTTLYVTLEPCHMCAGAMVHARVARLVFGAREPKAGCIESRAQLLSADYLNHQVQVEAGVCGDQCAAQLQAFFRMRREQHRAAKLSGKTDNKQG